MRGVVTFVKHFTAKGEKNGKPWTRHDFRDAGGTKYQTFDDQLANRADGLLNQPVEIEYEVVERNGYQNNELKSVKPAGGEAKQETTVVPQGSEQDRQLRIMRQSGLDRAISTVAAGIVKTGSGEDGEVLVSDLFEISDHFINYFENGR